MMIMQQGPQVAQIMGPRGLGEIIPALGGALRALITPTTMFLAGLTAVGYVGAGVFRAFRPEIEALDVALQRHIDRLGELEQGWKRTANAARSAGERSQLVTGFQSQQAIDALRRSFAQQTALGTLDPQLLIDRILPGPFGDDPSGVNYSVNASDRRLGLEPILMELMRSIEAGTPQIAKFNDELAAMGQAPEASSALKKRVAEILEFTAALGQAQAAINAYDRNFGPGGLLRGGSEFNRRDMQEYDRFRIEEQGKLNSMRREADARLLGIDARSPQERAAAARAAEAARFVADESAAVRALRIRIAETQALAEAEHQVAEASRERRRAMEETLAGAKLDVELTGRSVAETERLRLEHELLAQVRQQAADNGIAVSEAEIANIQRLAAEGGAGCGRSRARREILVGNQEQLERLRLERQLIGEGNVDRERMIALLEAEQEIRRLGIDAQGAEANAMRDNARAIAEETAELERGADAWRTYQSAGESAIDGLVDKLAKGDLKGAIEGLASDLGKTLLELSVSNPLKNAILGTNHGTLDDLGGIGGIFNRLLNGPSKADDSIVSSVLGGGQAVGSMSVTAAVVDVNGGIGGLPFEDGKGGGLLGLLGIDRPGTAGSVIKLDEVVSKAFDPAGITKTGIPSSAVTAANGMTAKVASQYADRFQGLLNDLAARGYDVRSLGEGGYSYRNVAGTNTLSKHSFGEALDINPRENPHSYNFRTDMPSDINEIARRNGLTWGGNWRKPDTMPLPGRQVRRAPRPYCGSSKPVRRQDDHAGGRCRQGPWRARRRPQQFREATVEHSLRRTGGPGCRWRRSPGAPVRRRPELLPSRAGARARHDELEHDRPVGDRRLHRHGRSFQRRRPGASR
jgi:hypothetical protein